MARQQIEKRKAEQRAETKKANKEKKVDASGGRSSTRDKKPKIKEEAEVDAGSKRKRKSEVNGSAKKVKVEDDKVSLPSAISMIHS